MVKRGKQCGLGREGVSNLQEGGVLQTQWDEAARMCDRCVGSDLQHTSCQCIRMFLKLGEMGLRARVSLQARSLFSYRKKFNNSFQQLSVASLRNCSIQTVLNSMCQFLPHFLSALSLRRKTMTMIPFLYKNTMHLKTGAPTENLLISQ